MRILYATDGSPDARAAGEWLKDFPIPAASHVLAVTAVSLPPSVLDIPTVRSYYDELRATGQAVAEQARLGLADRWETSTRVVEGDPREAIPKLAAEWDADLIVVGVRGHGAVKSFLLGSVSMAVVRHAPCPVLVVKGWPPGLRKVVIAVDGSSHSMVAARFFAALPLDRKLSVQLVGVAEPPRLSVAAPEALAAPLLPVLGELAQARRSRLEGVLAGLESELGPKVGHIERLAILGHPVEEIIAAAGGSGVGLVVVGARGHGAVKRIVLGSVSERVLHHAPCSVLVVKGRGAPAS